MEGVEEAHKAAVASCHRVLSLLCQPQQDQVGFRNLEAETGKAVFRFKRVVSLLNNGLGHARVRKLKKLQIPFPESVLLDSPNCTTEHRSNTPQFLRSRFSENPSQELSLGVRNSLSLGNPSLELSTNNGKNPIQLVQQALPAAHYQFFQQQQQQQRLLLQQQKMKQQAEMMRRRSHSGINLNFDSSSCTPTMSSTRSFISSLSIDGSVAKMDGNSFHLIGAPVSSDQNSQHKRKCSARGDDGSAKCGSSNSRCHCSKKRKHRVKRTIKVPAISNKLADIPPDDYSWRKYGQKPIKGSPHPRSNRNHPLILRPHCRRVVKIRLRLPTLKPKLKEKPAKVARSSPGRKAPTVGVTKAAAAKKAPTLTVKPRSVKSPAKKAPARKARK